MITSLIDSKQIDLLVLRQNSCSGKGISLIQFRSMIKINKILMELFKLLEDLTLIFWYLTLILGI